MRLIIRESKSFWKIMIWNVMLFGIILVLLGLTPGISEAVRQYSLTITKRAMLSRGVAGIRKNTLIINLPGSTKAVKEISEYLIDTLSHGWDILKGTASECGQKE